jgi:hypothetical protein
VLVGALVGGIVVFVGTGVLVRVFVGGPGVNVGVDGRGVLVCVRVRVGVRESVAVGLSVRVDVG